jgi:two-component system sensor histidine kinase UhpB
VLDTLPVGVVVTNPEGDVLLANVVSTRIWGEQVIESGPERRALSRGRWHDSGKKIAPDEWASKRAVTEGQTSLNELIDIETFDDKHKIIQNSAAPIRDAKGSIIGAVIVNEDVTERVRTQDALQASERILREAEELGHTGSWELNLLTGEIVNTEENLRLFFGDDRTKGARFEDYAEVVHPDDRGFVLRDREQLLAEGKPRDIEYRVVWPNGEVHVIFGRATVVRDESGKPTRVHGTNLDITGRKRAEESLRDSANRQRYLSHRLLAAQEEERLHLSRELHDGFGQLIAAITVQLHAARSLAGAEAQSRLEECAALLQRAGAEVRNLALDLRPAMLETAGLDATLRWLAEEHQRRTGVPTAVVGHLAAVRSELAIVCFRVVQEALTNILRHADAYHVRIELSQTESTLEIVVCDDGVGFDAAVTFDRAALSGHFGLVGMKERVQILGGCLDVRSSRGRGTEVHVSLPTVDANPSAEEPLE